MGLKSRFRGLRFYYQVDGERMSDKYATIEDFLRTKFPKSGSPYAPNLGTEIFNITWNRNKISISDSIHTVGELVKVLSGDCYISNKDIRYLDIASKHKGLIRKEIYSVEEIRQATKDVLFLSDKNKADINLDGDLIRGNSQRYQTFFTKGCTCVSCGIEGKFFAKERCASQSRYHLNLYAYDADGNEVLMTKDHIIPKSKGGKNHVSNYQTMCKICNELKGSNMEE